jgi:hypothetical protein
VRETPVASVRWRHGAARAASALSLAILGSVLWRVAVAPSPGFQIQRALALAAFFLSLAILARHGLAHRARPWLIACLVFVVTMANGRYGGAGDTIPASHLDFQIIRHHTLTFDTASYLHGGAEGLPYWLSRVGPHIYSRYPIATPLLALPVFVVPALGRFDPADSSVQDIDKTAASLLTVASIVLLFLALRRLVSEGAAVAATVLLALGTSVLTISSQALWQHTGATLGIALAIYGLLVPSSAFGRGVLVGIGCGVTIASRPIDVVLVAFVGLAALLQDRRQAVIAALVAAVPVALAALYNTHVFGNPFATGYGDEAVNGWSTPWLDGFAGLLLSPGRGLLTYSPVLVFAIAPLVAAPVAAETRLILRALAAGAFCYLAVMAKWWCWHGGWCLGPRMLLDSLPIWTLGLAIAIDRAWNRPVRRTLLGAAAVVSVFVHLLCAYVPMNDRMFQLVIQLHPSVWGIRSYPPVALYVSARRR